MKNNVYLTEDDQTFLLWMLDNYINDLDYLFSSKEEAKSIINKIDNIDETD
jgi:hypothetical protein